jgi:PHD/YefM family antitoxin component YafN of YafNO toxin-antitoxin module
MQTYFMIKKSLTFVLIVSLVLITGCSKKEAVVDDKLSFNIQTLTVDDLSTIALWEKVGSLMDQQQITVTAQVA